MHPRDDLGAVVQILLVGGQIGLGAQGGDRGAKLVGGVGDQGLHGGELAVEPAHEAVDRLHHRVHFARDGGVDRREVLRIAGGEAGGDPVERAQRPAHDEDGKGQERDAADHQTAQRVAGDVDGEFAARDLGLADDHLDRARELPFGEAAGQADEPRGLARETRVVEHGIGGILGRQRQVVIAGDHRAARPAQLVGDAVVGGERQQFEGRDRQVDDGRAVGHRDRGGDVLRGADQQPVEGLAGGGAAVAEGGERQGEAADHQQRGQPEHQPRRER